MSKAVAETGNNWVRLFRRCLAFVLPAVVAGFIGATILSLTVLNDIISTGPPVEGEAFHINLSGLILIGTIMGATWGQLATILMGLPAHIALLHYTRRRAWMYAVAGAIAGVMFSVTFVLAVLFGLSPPDAVGFAWLLAAGALSGAIGGLTFWLIRRPDRDAVSASPTA